MKAGVQHDDGEGENVTSIGIFENVVLALTIAVPLCETLHHPVDLLRLSGKSKTPQELSTKKNKLEKFSTTTPVFGILQKIRYSLWKIYNQFFLLFVLTKKLSAYNTHILFKNIS